MWGLERGKASLLGVHALRRDHRLGALERRLRRVHVLPARGGDRLADLKAAGRMRGREKEGDEMV